MPGHENRVARLQSELEDAGASWSAAPTPLSRLSEEEQARRLGYVPGPEEPSLQEQEEIAAAKVEEHEQTSASARADEGISDDEGYGAPASFDWRTGGYITPIKNQGGCGSCVAFGTAATLEGTLRVSRGDPNLAIDLSEAQLFYCYGAAAGRNCGNGWWVPNAMDACKGGLAPENYFPYTAGNQGCNVAAGWQGAAVRVVNWHTVSAVADMKNWISSRGPVAACFNVYQDFFSYSSGVYHYVSGSLAGGHCISVVGYSDADSCWICKNSWGTGWGESGFFRIRYGDCGIDSAMYAVDSLASWINGKLVRGLWSIDQDRNAWVYLDGAGWRRVAADNDNIFFDQLTQLASAKNSGRPVNVYDEAGVIRQVYVL